ncbi:hypothetical protein HK097_010610 [Rhizophlyctis rosea]|uniref:Xylanolytic transcriptional activator regulatory domain-containing protein n=1 Tax=Rhizophlyctis rosea TaxID=64517 RepID=A0AAD5SK91_9FUNG|nr:hypothetical protein HK097_010610 [Rhizophlyctis rosea]
MLIEQKKRGPKKGANTNSGKVTKPRRKSVTMTPRIAVECEEDGDSTDDEEVEEYDIDESNPLGEDEGLFDMMDSTFEMGQQAEDDGVFPFGLPSPVESPTETPDLANPNPAPNLLSSPLTPLLLGSSVPLLQELADTAPTLAEAGPSALGDSSIITPSILKDSYMSSADMYFGDAMGSNFGGIDLNSLNFGGNDMGSFASTPPTQSQQLPMAALAATSYDAAEVKPQPQPFAPTASTAFFSTPFLFGPIGLTIPELPNLLPDFYLHLISLFFTYFHPTLPLIHERTFFENLVPVNNHHPMLLNAMYAIGCLYSRHPQLYQAPFGSPQKASEYFATRAVNVVPLGQMSSGKKSSQSVESLSTCVATLLLAVGDFGARKQGRTWTHAASGCRVAQKFDLAYDKTTDDFFSLFNGTKRQEVYGTPEERKRAWWGALLVDSFSNLSTGLPMLISESDYANTMLHSDASVSRDSSNLTMEYSRILSSDAGSQSHEQSHDTWQPFFSTATSNSIFGSAPISFGSDVQHMLTPMSDAAHLVQASFLLRRVVRFCSSRDFSSGAARNPCFAAFLPPPTSVVQMHLALVAWYERLPAALQLIGNLEKVFCGDAQNDATTPNERLSAPAVTVNLMFLMALAVLHQRDTCSASSQQERIIHQLKTYPLSTSTTSNPNLLTSLDVILGVYRAQCHILRRVYRGQTPSAATTAPPPELVASPMIPCFLAPAAVVLLEHPTYAAMLLRDSHSRRDSMSYNSGYATNDGKDVAATVEPLESLLLPALDNVAQVWATSSSYSANLRGLVEVVKGRWRKTKVQL